MAAPLVYAVADVLAGRLWAGYSFRDQTISELGAIGAPSRVAFSILLLLVYLLMVAFGVGIWQVSDGNRRLKAVGGLIIGLGVLALTVGQFAAMRMRGIEQGLAGTLHLVEGMVAMLLVFTSMGIAATALGRRFRVYTIVTIAFALVFGAWSTLDVSRVERDWPTPWLGVKERVFWYGYQSWYIVLALALLGRRNFRAAAE